MNSKLLGFHSVSEIFILALKVVKKCVFFKFTPCGKKMAFVIEFLVLGKNLHFYEASGNNFPHTRISKDKFPNHFSSSVGSFMYRFIMTMKTMVGFLIKQ